MFSFHLSFFSTLFPRYPFLLAACRDVGATWIRRHTGVGPTFLQIRQKLRYYADEDYYPNLDCSYSSDEISHSEGKEVCLLHSFTKEAIC